MISLISVIYIQVISLDCHFDNVYEVFLCLQRRADVLKRGLDEAREDRDEKERKIAVLQAKLERSKKNMVYGESEKGAIEEEVDRLKKLLKESTK